jgi:hypothetical protein
MAMKRAPALLLVLGLSLAPGCAAAVQAVDGSVTVYCAVHTGSTETSCITTTNVPTSEEGTAENECTGNGGAIAGSCPSSGIIGCCTQTESTIAANVTAETCFCAGTASTLKGECSGTWTE